jgi:hypothetical protein
MFEKEIIFKERVAARCHLSSVAAAKPSQNRGQVTRSLSASRLVGTNLAQPVTRRRGDATRRPEDRRDKALS